VALDLHGIDEYNNVLCVLLFITHIYIDHMFMVGLLQT
jgi:hypothetical protein